MDNNSVDNRVRNRNPTQTRRRTKSASPNRLRKTKSVAQQVTEYKIMKPVNITKNNPLLSRLKRSISVSGRLPRQQTLDATGRSIAAKKIAPRNRTMTNYYYHQLPLDLQRDVNEWVGQDSPTNKKAVNKQVRHYLFEKQIKNIKNLDNILIAALRSELEFEYLKKKKFTYLHMEYDKGKNSRFVTKDGRMYEDLLPKAAGALNSIKTIQKKIRNDFKDVKVVYDFQDPIVYFTYVPVADVAEYGRLPGKFKKKFKLYDGYLSQVSNFVNNYNTILDDEYLIHRWFCFEVSDNNIATDCTEDVDLDEDEDIGYDGVRFRGILYGGS